MTDPTWHLHIDATVAPYGDSDDLWQAWTLGLAPEVYGHGGTPAEALRCLAGCFGGAVVHLHVREVPDAD